jgi:hypothetical protein
MYTKHKNLTGKYDDMIYLKPTSMISNFFSKTQLKFRKFLVKLYLITASRQNNITGKNWAMKIPFMVTVNSGQVC